MLRRPIQASKLRFTEEPADIFINSTVDLVSYTVAELGRIPLVYEAAPGSGGLCGSTFLNRSFDDYLRRKFIHYNAWDDGYHQDSMHKFEVWIKKEFNGDPHKSFFVCARGLPSDTSLNISNGQLEIKGRALQQIFEPVISEVVSLVQSQIQVTHTTVSAVLLTGGFGMSKYLKKRIEEGIGSIKVIPIEDG